MSQQNYLTNHISGDYMPKQWRISGPCDTYREKGLRRGKPLHTERTHNCWCLPADHQFRYGLPRDRAQFKAGSTVTGCQGYILPAGSLTKDRAAIWRPGTQTRPDFGDRIAGKRRN